MHDLEVVHPYLQQKCDLDGPPPETLLTRLGKFNTRFGAFLESGAHELDHARVKILHPLVIAAFADTILKHGFGLLCRGIPQLYGHRIFHA